MTTSDEKPSAKKTVKKTDANKNKASPKASAPAKAAKESKPEAAKKSASGKPAKKTETTAKKSTAASSAKTTKQAASKENAAHTPILNRIKEAVVKAEKSYSHFHAPKNKKMSSTRPGDVRAQMHMERSLEEAKAFLDHVQTHHHLDTLMFDMRRFLSHETCGFHPHSFASYLSEEFSHDDLKIVKRHACSHYNKHRVIREISKWTSKAVNAN